MKHPAAAPLCIHPLVVATFATLLFASLFATAQTETVLYRFKGGADSGLPNAGLVNDKAGNLYGTTNGFQLGCGTVFELAKPTAPGKPWTEQVIHTFDCVNDGAPYDALIIDAAGNLYGTTFFNSNGSVFELSPPTTPDGAWTETELHTFTKLNGDGGGSVANLIMDSGGNLYGTTENGGTMTGVCAETSGCGVVFELSPPATQGGDWSETIVHAFRGSDGQVPAAGLIFDQLGNLYGTTFYGGPVNIGVVFRLAPPAAQGQLWRETVLYTFTGANDGGNPGANLTLRGKNLYGTLEVGPFAGPCSSCGAIFQLSPPAVQGNPWIETTLYAFAGGTDGYAPYAPVIFDHTGNLYTVTSYGGTSNNGTIVKLIPPSVLGGAWTESILYNFPGGASGAYPQGSLIVDPTGLMYSTTYGGGQKCSGSTTYCGTIFQFRQ